MPFASSIASDVKLKSSFVHYATLLADGVIVTNERRTFRIWFVYFRRLKCASSWVIFSAIMSNCPFYLTTILIHFSTESKSADDIDGHSSGSSTSIQGKLAVLRVPHHISSIFLLERQLSKRRVPRRFSYSQTKYKKTPTNNVFNLFSMKRTALLTTFTYARNRQSSANRLVVSFIYSKLYKFNPIFFFRILLLFSSYLQFFWTIPSARGQSSWIGQLIIDLSEYACLCQSKRSPMERRMAPWIAFGGKFMTKLNAWIMN